MPTRTLSGLLLAAGVSLASAAPAPLFSPGDLRTFKAADGLILTLSCYFGDKAKGCPPASQEAPAWLREDLPAMKERDCSQGATTEARAWADSLGDIGSFLHLAQQGGAPPAKQGKAAANPLPALKDVRNRFAHRLEMLESARFHRSLRGRGGNFLGRYRFVRDKMNESVAALGGGNRRGFREAALSIAWQVEELKQLFHSDPSDPFAEAGAPDCVGLEAFAARAPAPSQQELDRLVRLGTNYRSGGEAAKAQRAFELALAMAETLGDAEAQQSLHHQSADLWLAQGGVEQALPHMDRALALARSRNDLVSERDLLQSFAQALRGLGREEQLRSNYEDQAERVQRRIETALQGYQRGERFLAQGRYEDAKREYLQTGQLGHAVSYVKIGVCETKLGNVEGAVAANLEALRLARLQEKKHPEAMALQALAAIYGEQGNAHAATEAIESLLRMGLSQDPAQLPPEVRWQLENRRAPHLATLENLYNLSDRWERGGQVFDELARAAQALGLRDDALRARVHRARARVAGGDPEAGATLFAEAVQTVGAAEGLRIETLEFLHRSLFALQPYWGPELRDFAAAFNRLLSDIKRRRSKSLQDAAAAARGRKDLAELQAEFAVATDWEVRARFELGRALEAGSHEAAAAEQAIAEYGRALALAGRLRRPDYRVACWRGLARMHAARQEWPAAAEALERALTTALWKDGRTLQEADPSLRALDSAVALKLGEPEIVGDILRQIGHVTLGQGVPLTAMDFIQRSLAVQPSELVRIRTFVEFAKLLELSGYEGHAATFLEKLLAEGRVEGAPRLKATVLMSLAAVQRKTGGLGEDFALERLETALALLRPRGLNTKDLELLLALGDLRLKKGKGVAAAEAYETAIQVSEHFRAALADESARLSLLAGDPDYLSNYQAAIGGMMAVAARDAAFVDRAYAAAETARTRALLDSLRGADLEREGPLRREATALNQRLAMVAQKGLDEGWSPEDAIAFSSLQDRQARLAEEIRRQDPQYAALRYGRPSSLAGLAQVLRLGEVFVSFKFAGREAGMWAFVMHAGRAPRLVRLDADAARALLRDLPPPAPRRPTEVWQIVPERLGQVLWAPLEAELKGATKVFIVPDGELWTVPWSALDSGGQSLVDKPYTVQVIPSGTVLADLRTAPRGRSEVDLIGFAPFAGQAPGTASGKAGPPSPEKGGKSRDTARGQSLGAETAVRLEAALPAASELLERLRWSFPGARTFLPPEATKRRALAESGRARYVVYYTRCQAEERNPWLSAVVFAEEAGRAAPLTVTEIMRLMRLDATELVVLGACETARGQFARGEGMMGLTRGLFYAGARGVVATGWPVAEESTRDVVLGLFQGIHLGLDPARALQKAQQDVRQRKYGRSPGEHPYFWAGFQIYGDPQ